MVICDVDSDGSAQSVIFLNQEQDSSLSPVRTTQEKIGILRQVKKTEENRKKKRKRKRKHRAQV